MASLVLEGDTLAGGRGGGARDDMRRRLCRRDMSKRVRRVVAIVVRGTDRPHSVQFQLSLCNSTIVCLDNYNASVIETLVCPHKGNPKEET